MRRIAFVLEVVSRNLDRVTYVLAVPLGIFFLGVVFANVLARYVFSAPIIGSVEFARIAFVWATFIGAAMAVRRRSHIRLEFVAERLPALVQRLLGIFVWLLIIAFLAFVTYQGWRLTGRVQRTFFPASGLSQVYLYIPLPVTAAIMIVHALAHFFRDIVALVDDRAARTGLATSPHEPHPRRTP